MSAWTPADRRIGIVSALCVPLLGLAYHVSGAVGMLARHDFSWDSLLPAEPFLTVCRLLMLLLTADLVLLFVTVHGFAAPDRKTCSLTAVAFVIVFATIT